MLCTFLFMLSVMCGLAWPVPCVRYKVAEPETRYDPVLLEKELFKQPVRWLVRNVELFLPLGTFAAKVLIDVQVGRRQVQSIAE